MFKIDINVDHFSPSYHKLVIQCNSDFSTYIQCQSSSSSSLTSPSFWHDALQLHALVHTNPYLAHPHHVSQSVLHQHVIRSWHIFGIGFNRVVSPLESEVTEVGYMPIIPAPADDIHCHSKVSEKLAQYSTVIIFDQAMYWGLVWLTMNWIVL